MNVSTRFLILLIILATGCAASEGQPSAKTPHSSKSSLLKINGLETKDKTLRLQVMSNGCTKAESFKLIWQGSNLTVKRIKLDYCRGMPRKIWLEFKMPAQTKAFTLVNKFES